AMSLLSFFTSSTISDSLSSYFFFFCSDTHPYLHSFPTRRSSDLPVGLLRVLPPGDARAGRPERVAARHAGLHGPPRSHRAARPRSEEHTSELQSRFDLVCRLLLEKKKI